MCSLVQHLYNYCSYKCSKTYRSSTVTTTNSQQAESKFALHLYILQSTSLWLEFEFVFLGSALLLCQSLLLKLKMLLDMLIILKRLLPPLIVADVEEHASVLYVNLHVPYACVMQLFLSHLKPTCWIPQVITPMCLLVYLEGAQHSRAVGIHDTRKLYVYSKTVFLFNN